MRALSLRASAGSLLLAVALVACTDAPLGPSLGAESLQSTTASTGGVVISQVYGGNGSTYTHDFVELFNAGAVKVSLSGWSIQYASATGTGTFGSNAITTLSDSIAPGQYYLVRLASATTGAALPAHDASGTVNLSATAGKVALVSQTTGLACNGGSTPCTSEQLSKIVDLVGYGGANFYEGSGATPAPSSTTAAFRKNGGCTDTNYNAADFSVAVPAPRNSASPTKTCAATPVPAVASVTVAPTPATVSVGATVTLTATAYDGSGQAISGTSFTWTTSDAAVATVDAAGAVTGVAAGSATITATAPNGVAGTASVTVGTVSGSASNVRVTEFHYDNDSADVGEAIEIEGDANGSLAGWSLVLYSGSTGSANQGQSYGTIQLSGTFGSTCGGTRGVLVFNAPGLQNGDKDGFALVNAAGAVVEFLSYEGSFTATNGPAAGMTSTDVGVAEASTTPIGHSLQRAGNGVWFGPYTNTFGACNPATPPAPQTGISFSGRHPTGDPALPVGFQDQLFATLRDANTGATVQTTFTWISETPELASVDRNGVITSRSAGTATFRATAADGTTNTYSLPMIVGTASTTASYAGNAEFGEPADGDASDDYILRYPQYTASWNSKRGTPNWVSYNLEATHFGPEDRCDCFTYDAELPEAGRYTTADYTGAAAINGYSIDRGHLARSADRTGASLDNARTFYFSNIIPQASDNNQGPWAVMETYLGNIAKAGDREVYIVAGVAGSKGTVKNEGKIVIPARTWKVAVIMPRDKGLADVQKAEDIEVIAVDMPNDAGIRNVNWESYKTTVHTLEQLTGYDLLDKLPEAVECKVEVRNCAPLASIESPSYVMTEGTALSINSTGSIDPDGDVLTFTWSVNDVVTAAGAVLTHTFSDNGRYTVQLTVTDSHGASSVATSYVTVTNVAPKVNAFTGATGLQGETYGGEGRFMDPGADTWTATVDYGDGSGVQPLALSGKEFTLSHPYSKAGEFTVTVTITDKDGESGTQTATVVVQTPQEGIVSLSGTIDDMLSGGAQTASVGTTSGGALSAGNATALKSTLWAARDQLERKNNSTAVKQMQAFINQVNGLVAERKLSESNGQRLTTFATRIIGSINR